MIEKGGSGKPLYITFDRRDSDKYRFIFTPSKTGKREVIKYHYPPEAIIALPISMPEIIHKYHNKNEFFMLIDAIMKQQQKRTI